MVSDARSGKIYNRVDQSLGEYVKSKRGIGVVRVWRQEMRKKRKKSRARLARLSEVMALMEGYSPCETRLSLEYVCFIFLEVVAPNKVHKQEHFQNI